MRPSLTPELTTLESARLIQRLESESELEYFFRHGLIQEAAYASLLKSDRRLLHHRVAEILEHHYQSNPEEVFGLLAYHYQQAEISDKARRYLFLAGESAQARYANRDAIRFYTEALALTPETDLEARYVIVEARERVYDILGERALQWQDLETLKAWLEALSVDPSRRAGLLLRQGDYADKTGDYAEAGRLAKQAIALAHTAGQVKQEVQGYFQWGVSLWRAADYAAARPPVEQARTKARANHLLALEADSVRLLGVLADSQSDYATARGHFEEALNLKRAIGDQRGVSQALNSLGIVAFHQNQYLDAQRDFEASLQLKRQLGDRIGEISTLHNLSNVLVHVGRLTEAEAHYTQAVRACREIHDPDGEASALLGLAMTEAAMGQYDLARPHFERAEALFRDVGDREGEAEALAGLGAFGYATGADEQALHNAERAYAIAVALSNENIQGYTLTTCGHIRLRSGQLAEAAEAYQLAIQLRQAMKQSSLVIESQAGLARVHLAEGRLAQALTLVEEILTRLNLPALNGADDPIKIYLTGYHILRAAQDPRASALLAAGYAALQERAANISDEARRQVFLDRVPSHRELLALYKPA